MPKLTIATKYKANASGPGHYEIWKNYDCPRNEHAFPVKSPDECEAECTKLVNHHPSPCSAYVVTGLQNRMCVLESSAEYCTCLLKSETSGCASNSSQESVLGKRIGNY